MTWSLYFQAFFLVSESFWNTFLTHISAWTLFMFVHLPHLSQPLTLFHKVLWQICVSQTWSKPGTVSVFTAMFSSHCKALIIKYHCNFCVIFMWRRYYIPTTVYLWTQLKPCLLKSKEGFLQSCILHSLTAPFVLFNERNYVLIYWWQVHHRS